MSFLCSTLYSITLFYEAWVGVLACTLSVYTLLALKILRLILILRSYNFIRVMS